MLDPDVVADEAVGAAEGGDGAIVVAGQRRERREVDAGGPAFRAGSHLDDLLVRHREACAPQQQPRLVLGQAEVADAKLDEPSGCPHGGDRERGPRAAREHEPPGRWKLVDQRADDSEALLAGEQVQVVDDQGERACRLERSVEAGEHRRQGAPRLRERLDDAAVAHPDPVQRERQVREQRDRVVVALVDAQPGGRLRAGPPEEVGEERRLAVSGGRDDQCDSGRRRAQTADELAALDRPGPQAGRAEARLHHAERSLLWQSGA